MSTTKRNEAQTREVLQELGCTDIQREIGKHVKWRYKTPRGNPALLITAISSSDWRVLKNQRAMIRVTIREKDGE